MQLNDVESIVGCINSLNGDYKTLRNERLAEAITLLSSRKLLESISIDVDPISKTWDGVLLLSPKKRCEPQVVCEILFCNPQELTWEVAAHSGDFTKQLYIKNLDEVKRPIMESYDKVKLVGKYIRAKWDEA